MQHALQLVAIGVTIGTVAATGLAQNALDRNLQVGSGGVNQSAAPVDYTTRNLVVTGNVAGGREFRGAIDYNAPGAFGDQLGSDDLFRFRARSMSLTPLSRQGRAFTNLAPRPIFTDSHGLSAGDVYKQRATQLPTVQARPTALANYRRTVGSLATTALAGAGEPRGPFTMIRTKRGDLVRLEASELRGVRAIPLLPEAPTLIPADDEAISAAAAQRRDVAGSEADQDDKGDADLLDESGAPMRIDESPMWNPSIEIGHQLMALVQPQVVAAKVDQMEQRIVLIEHVILDPRKTQDVEPGEDVYLDMLRQIEAQARGEPAADQADAGDEQKDQQPQDDEGSQTGSESPEEQTLELPSYEKLVAAQEARIRAIREMYALPPALADDADQPQADADELPLPSQLGRLIRKLDHDLPALSSMAGKSDTRVNVLFRDAETYIAEGKYFKAEHAYKKILMFQVNHPLGSAGVIHAQLGVGMIRSAAMSLRQHFRRHPEMMATRYRPELLPEASRLRTITRRIERFVESNDRSGPALLLAYLGYQADSPKLVRYGLDLAQSREPNDPLLPLLRRIWLVDSKNQAAIADFRAQEPAAAAPAPLSVDAPVDEDTTPPQTTK